ncbi:aspartate/glutamate racemase family protein [Roseibium algae]|uniref:Aspartate/glutamate racemase family protein n=1 Tax=Roseibium algae TaxID=3123038 RepID=A0ABU8TJR3_9HYPH
MKPCPVSLSKEAVQFNDVADTARIGLIALATDLTSEGDLYRQLPEEGVSIHVARIAFENPISPEQLRTMAPRLTGTAGLLAPLQPLRAVCYSCTSASVVIGDAEVLSAVQKAVGNVPVVTPTSAARMAFAALDVTRIAVLTPYTVATSQTMAAYFTQHGFDIARFDCLGLEDDRDMALVSDQTIIKAAMAADTPDAEALFISCTGLPAIRVIEELEHHLKKPVVTSNQASAWAMSRLAGLHDHKPSRYGQLFSCPPPKDAFS